MDSILVEAPPVTQAQTDFAMPPQWKNLALLHNKAVAQTLGDQQQMGDGRTQRGSHHRTRTIEATMRKGLLRRRPPKDALPGGKSDHPDAQALMWDTFCTGQNRGILNVADTIIAKK